MQIQKARTQGFCFGVELTYKKALSETAERGDVHTMGNIVHNPLIVKELEEKGLQVTSNPWTISRIRHPFRPRARFTTPDHRSGGSKGAARG